MKAVAVGVLLAVGLVAFAMSDVGAEEERIEIYRTARADFEGFPSGPVFIGIVGSDDRPGVSGARADAVHVIGVNPQQGRGTIINIPRDTYINVPGRGQARINEAHVGGNAPLMAETLRQFTGADIQYLITTNFEGFTGIVDAMGGVSVDVPYDIFDSASGANFPAGKRTLSGPQALAMARARKSVPGGDFGRTENQGRLLRAGLAQVREGNTGPARTIQLVAILLRHVKTSVGVSPVELYKLARLAISLKPDRIANITMPGTTGLAGAASVVFPAGNYREIFADFADDGVVSSG